MIPDCFFCSAAPVKGVLISASWFKEMDHSRQGFEHRYPVHPAPVRDHMTESTTQRSHRGMRQHVLSSSSGSVLPSRDQSHDASNSDDGILRTAFYGKSGFGILQKGEKDFLILFETGKGPAGEICAVSGGAVLHKSLDTGLNAHKPVNFIIIL